MGTVINLDTGSPRIRNRKTLVVQLKCKKIWSRIVHHGAKHVADSANFTTAVLTAPQSISCQSSHPIRVYVNNRHGSEEWFSAAPLGKKTSKFLLTYRL